MLIEVACFFEVDQGLVFRLDRELRAITLREREVVRAKVKFWRKLTPGALLTFLPTYSLNNRLVSLLKFN